MAHLVAQLCDGACSERIHRAAVLSGCARCKQLALQANRLASEQASAHPMLAQSDRPLGSYAPGTGIPSVQRYRTCSGHGRCRFIQSKKSPADSAMLLATRFGNPPCGRRRHHLRSGCPLRKALAFKSPACRSAARPAKLNALSAPPAMASICDRSILSLPIRKSRIWSRVAARRAGSPTAIRRQTCRFHRRR